jgi:hypothetical protein
MVDPLFFILKFMFDFWWFFLPILFFYIFWEKFTGFQKSKTGKQLQWGFLEIKFPSGIMRSPRAMEEVFNALHAIAPDPEIDLTWVNLNFKGFIPKSYVFLIIAHNQKIRFFIRFPLELKDFIKSRFYSQYPEIQFIDVEDPYNFLPPKIPNLLFDTEIFAVHLKKEDIYPIKTYAELENLPKEQQMDLMTTFSEAAWQISDKEWLIFQIGLLPTTADNEVHGKKWVERGQKVVDKLIGKKESQNQKANFLDPIFEFMVNLLLAIVREPQWKTSEEKPKEEVNLQKLTPGEKKVLEMVQQKLSKLGFWCSCKAAYIATRQIFDDKRSSAISLMLSVLKNFSSENLNAFKLHSLTFTKKKTLSRKKFLIKRKEFANLKKYKMDDKKFSFILNSEELASLVHPPMEFVGSAGVEKSPVRELPPSSEIPSPEL